MKSPSVISGVIELKVLQYIKEGRATTASEINNGLCEQFAMDVLLLLGPSHDPWHIYGAENFRVGHHGNVEGDDRWDWVLLSTGWGIQPPNRLSYSDLDAIPFGGHVWLSDGVRHYDAECPDGVASFFDLPFFKSKLPNLMCDMERDVDNGVQVNLG